MTSLALRMSITIKGECLPQRWRTSIHVMILKEYGNYDVSKCRSIQLLEPDLNGILKIKVNKVMNGTMTYKRS